MTVPATDGPAIFRIGVTGHTGLARGTDHLVFEAVLATLYQHATHTRLHGVTCLARGVDQIFANAVLRLRGTFEAVIPARDYRRQMTRPSDRASYDTLLRQATRTTVLPFPRSRRCAYVAASRRMLSLCDAVVAVWDGRPVRCLGDTAHIVAIARSRALPVTVVWPAGAICE